MVLDMMILTPSPTSTQREKLGQEYMDVTDVALNEWSRNKTKKIAVLDFYFNPCDVQWKGKVIWVADFEFFTMMVKDWMVRYKQTKEQVLDDMFEM